MLEEEGGFVNHPNDPGGATNMGITQATYSNWVKRDVDEQEMRDLTVYDVAPIYYDMYWEKLNCYWLPVGIDLVLFDMGVNAGIQTAGKLLQRQLGTVKVDGIIGSKTIAEANGTIDSANIYDEIEMYACLREEFYRGLSHFDTFGRGWLDRVQNASVKARELVEIYG